MGPAPALEQERHVIDDDLAVGERRPRAERMRGHERPQDVGVGFREVRGYVHAGLR